METLRGAMAERGWSGASGWFRVFYLYLFRAWFWPLCAESLPANLGPLLRRLQGVKVGQGVFIDRSVVLDGIYPELISVGDDARLAPRCIVYCHCKAGRLLASGPLPDVVAPVTIGPSAFVGLGVIIMPGVTVGRGAVLVSGAVVFGNVPDFAVASGNPARVIRQLTPPEGEKTGDGV
ncbi:MAG: acyltransferase [Verrucomicrobiota bacterium]|nr:acyltransferase [Verrucomicrobiota bacterium]